MKTLLKELSEAPKWFWWSLLGVVLAGPVVGYTAVAYYITHF